MQSSEKSFLQELIDTFSVATGLNVVAVDTDGEAFVSSEYYNTTAYCQYVRSMEGGCGRCRRSYRKACQEAARWKEPYFFRCHAGLVMWALPIMVEEETVGAVICGQALLWEPDELFLEEIQRIFFGRHAFQMDRLVEHIRKLPVLSAERCQSAADLLSVIVRYMANTYDTVFMEQKRKLAWRHTILTSLQQRQEQLAAEHFDYSVYLRRERRFLQYLRMSDEERAKKLLPVLFTDISVLNQHNLQHIRRALLELMVLASRAWIESGLEDLVVSEFMDAYYREMGGSMTEEEQFFCTYQLCEKLFEAGYLHASQEHYVSILRNAKKFLHDHYAEPIQVEEVAASVGLSKSYLSALFRQNLNTTVHDYLLRIRIEQSIRLMADREKSLEQILLACGFHSQSYYTKVFRRFLGVTPGQYRNRLL